LLSRLSVPPVKLPRPLNVFAPVSASVPVPSFWTAVVLIPFWMIPAKVPASATSVAGVAPLLVMVPLPVRFAVVVPMPFSSRCRRRRHSACCRCRGEQGRRGIERLEGAGIHRHGETGHHDRARTAQSERAGVAGRTEMQCADRRRAGSEIEASGQGRRLAGACCDVTSSPPPT